MRLLVSLILFCALVASGCAGRKTPAQPRARATAAPSRSQGTNQTLIVTPENALVGKVATVNTTARFVVLNFPLGKMATMDQRLNLYRRGLKVGEVKVTGPQRAFWRQGGLGVSAGPGAKRQVSADRPRSFP